MCFTNTKRIKKFLIRFHPFANSPFLNDANGHWRKGISEKIEQMARPKLGENKKNNRVGVFYTDKEFAEVCEKAKSLGLETAEFLRQISLGNRVETRAFVPEVNKETAQIINDGITALNRMMRLIHAGQAERLPEGWLEILREEMKQTRETLLGRKWQ